MKKLIALLMAAVLVLSLMAGCSKKEEKETTPTAIPRPPRTYSPAAAPTAPRPAPPPMATPPAVATWTRTCPLPTATWRLIPRSRPATAT